MISLILIACHMVGDYIAQNDWMAANKLKDPIVRAIHVTAYCFCFIPAVLYARPPIDSLEQFGTSISFFGLLWITHFITDSRRWASGDKWPPKPILVDQSIHLVTLAILGAVFLEKS